MRSRIMGAIHYGIAMAILSITAFAALYLPTARAAYGAAPDTNVSCVDFGRQRIWLKGATPASLTTPLVLGSVYVIEMTVETGDGLHDGRRYQPGERVTAFIGSVEVGTTHDIPDIDPTFRTQSFAVGAQIDVAFIKVVHAPIVAPDSVEVGLVCISWLANAPTTTTTTTPPSTAAPTTTASPATTAAPSTTAAPTTTVAAPAVVSISPSTTTLPAPEVEGAQQLAFTGSSGTLIMIAVALVLLDIGYMSWSSTRIDRR